MTSLESAHSCLQKAQLPPDMLEKWEGLTNLIHSFQSAAVAFSGGVDSSFLAYVSALVLGEKCTAFTIQSVIESDDQITRAIDFAREFGIRHRVIPFNPLEIELIKSNPPDRCYHCKKHILGLIKDLALASGIETILEGQNKDDESDYRPGRRAVIETGTYSPLAQNGITKAEIRLFARALGLPIWDQPSSPCLATRFPYHTPLTVDGLQQVAQAEAFLHQKGFSIVRVRVFSDLAKIETAQTDFERLIQIKDELIAVFKQMGFHQIALDLQGYRIGSLNEGIEK